MVTVLLCLLIIITYICYLWTLFAVSRKPPLTSLHIYSTKNEKHDDTFKDFMRQIGNGLLLVDQYEQKRAWMRLKTDHNLKQAVLDKLRFDDEKYETVLLALADDTSDDQKRKLLADLAVKQTANGNKAKAATEENIEDLLIDRLHMQRESQTVNAFNNVYLPMTIGEYVDYVKGHSRLGAYSKLDYRNSDGGNLETVNWTQEERDAYAFFNVDYFDEYLVTTTKPKAYQREYSDDLESDDADDSPMKMYQ